MTQQLRVVIAYSDEIGWSDLRKTLADLKVIRVVGDARSRDEVVEQALILRPHALLMASAIEGKPVIPLLRSLRPKLPRTTFVIIGHDFDPDELLALAEVGISGYLLWRHLTTANIEAHLLAALWGTTVVLHNEVAEEYVRRERMRLRMHASSPPVTHRERAILRAMADGLSVKEIGERVVTSERSVERTIAVLRDRFDAGSREGLLVKATLYGLIP